MLERRNWTYFLLGFVTCLALWRLAVICTISAEPPPYHLHGGNFTYSHPLHLLPPDDYTQLIDLNFTFSITNQVCNESNSPLLLVLVHSSPANTAKRRTIRETWGSRTAKIRLLFVLGLSNSTDLEKELQEEQRMYGDFIQGNFQDTYRNITYKHVMVLKYAIYHCPQAKYILKTDDDVFVHTQAMLNLISNDLSVHGASGVLFCTIRRNIIALRSYRSKWRVTFDEYPDKYYPTYCPGWNLLYSPDVVFQLYIEAQKSQYFWIDDIHITGTLAKRRNIVHTDIERFVLTGNDIYYLERDYNVTKPFLYGKANLEESVIRNLWKYAQTHPAPKNFLN